MTDERPTPEPPVEGPWPTSWLDRWFAPIRLPDGLEGELQALANEGSVVFVMRSSGLINYLYLTWLLRRLRLPPLRVAINFVGLFGWLAAVWRTRRALLDAASRRTASSVAFLNDAEGHEDAFAVLAERQRQLGHSIFLVPLILVWSRQAQRLVPPVWEWVWGTPDSPNTLPAAVAFLRNYRRAFLRVGRAVDLRGFVAERAGEGDELIGRKLRGTLRQYLARELRAAVGPPLRTPSRVEEKVLRDRHLKEVVGRVAAQKGRSHASVQREARRDLKEIASRYSPLFIEIVRPILRLVFRRLYEKVELDERGLAELRRLAAQKPLVLNPSHKSHIDYLILSYVFYENGLIPPQIAAGINLAFWPFGTIARWAGAFFIRRSFRGDKVYSATLRAYVKFLLRERFTQEFFPEGGRTRTGKLLFPMTGLYSMEVDAWLDGAAEDVLFVPIAVDYERLVEGGSYAKEIAGGEKKKESFGALLQTPRVLLRRYGRIYVQIGTPVSLGEVSGRKAAGGETLTLEPDEGDVETDTKRQLVQRLANRVAWGIAEVITVTPVTLVAAALIAHVRRGISDDELWHLVALLRSLAVEDGARLASDLAEASTVPGEPGPIHDALATFATSKVVTVEEAGGRVIYQVPDDKRTYLDFHRNAVLHRFAGPALVAQAARAAGSGASVDEVRRRARFLSRLFKLEFMYPLGATFESIFAQRFRVLAGHGLLSEEGGALRIGPDGPGLAFIADLVRPFLEAYRLAVETVRDAGLAGRAADRKALVKAALERGRADFLSGRILMRESVSKPTLENAVDWLSGQGAFTGDEGGRRVVAPEWLDRVSTHLVEEIGDYLRS